MSWSRHWPLLVACITPLALGPGLPRPAEAATTTADFSVRFDATWSSATHPVDFPAGAHFSRLVGGTHNGNVLFWQVGQTASDGIERMAETGAPFDLADEIQLHIPGDADQVILDAGGINSPGSTTVTFTANASHPFLTLVTMVAPSPDWFVGVSAHLLMSGGDWILEETVDLFAYDAGTDSGPTYTSPNQDTQPPDPISQIMAPPAYSGTRLGTYTITRTDVPEVPALGWIWGGTLGSALLLAGGLATRRRAQTTRRRAARAGTAGEAIERDKGA